MFQIYSDGDREGDYLLQFLALEGVDLLSKFYFLTAYSKHEDIRNSEDIKKLIDFKKFAAKNMFEKGDQSSLNKLKEIIGSSPTLNLQLENKIYLGVLRNKVGEGAYGLFLSILEKKDSEDSNVISESLVSIRNVYENILSEIALLQNVPKPYKRFNKELKKDEEIYFLDRNNNLKIGPFINWIKDKKPFNSNTIIKDFLFNIKNIGSDFGAHADLKDGKKKEKPASFSPTSNTVNALIYNLKEIILWFDQI